METHSSWSYAHPDISEAPLSARTINQFPMDTTRNQGIRFKRWKGPCHGGPLPTLPWARIAVEFTFETGYGLPGAHLKRLATSYNSIFFQQKIVALPPREVPDPAKKWLFWVMTQPNSDRFWNFFYILITIGLISWSAEDCVKKNFRNVRNTVHTGKFFASIPFRSISRYSKGHVLGPIVPNGPSNYISEDRYWKIYLEVR